MKKIRFLSIAMIALVFSLVMIFTSCAFLFNRPDDAFLFDEGTLRNVMRISDDRVPKGWLAVSPDGQSLLYAEQPTNFDPDRNLNFRHSRILLLRNAMVFTPTPLVESFNFAPAWYENGHNFVYITRNPDGSTQLIRSSITGGRTFVTRNPVGRGDNNPSVRGDVIAFDTFINGARQIVTIRDNGSELRILGRGSQPSWHPTENRLVFVRDGGIWEMCTETTQVTQILGVSQAESRTGVWNGRPSYSRDGRHILFVRNVRVGNSNWQHMYVMNADGSGLTDLTGGRANIWSPAWGVGNEVFFMSDAGLSGGRTEIWSALVTLDF